MVANISDTVHIILGGPSIANDLSVVILLVHHLAAAINVSWCISSIYILSFDKLFLLYNVN